MRPRTSPNVGLAPGAVLYLGDCEDRPDRFQLSSGTRAAAGVASSRYEPGAMIPSTPWRAPTERERAMLVTARAPKRYGVGVGILDIPAPLLRPFAAIRDAAAKKRSREEVLKLTARGRFDAAIGAIADHVRLHHRAGDDEDALPGVAGGIWINPPGRTTVTEPPDGEKLIGLHLDNWSDYPIHERADAPNRICINMGIEARFFMFINLPIGEMHKLIERTRPRALGAQKRGTIVARTFMRLIPTYPVIRVRIGPGEAYVAPTENLVHDASSLGMAGPDVNLTLRGRIAPAQRR